MKKLLQSVRKKILEHCLYKWINRTLKLILTKKKRDEDG